MVGQSQKQPRSCAGFARGRAWKGDKWNDAEAGELREQHKAERGLRAMVWVS